MSDTEPSIVRDLWQRDEYLLVNGVHEPAGTIVELGFQRVSSDEVASVIVGRRSAGDVTATATVGDLDDPEPFSGPGGTVIFLGDESTGSTGVVGVCAGGRSNLLWLAVFDFSNPFECRTLRILNDDQFAVQTNHRAEWIFSVADPTKIVVRRGDYGWPRSPFWPGPVG